ncbi:MAG TPA: tRNA (guanosine(46)-N7)-methyltransferase TrmB [Bacteroidales bacterium]|nr:tRNA (guanosine(46)-N7)-methyltransferase TrmB [Bacteroidales bacterium]
MGKNKLKKYEQTLQYSNILQPGKQTLFDGYELKGNWRNSLFNNNHKLIVELGAGKGETSLMLAQKYPNINFIAIDIKGDRLLKGAREAVELKLDNLVFLRMQIEHIHYAFDKDEIDEFWITFPDPFPKERRAKKRMTSSRFLTFYQQVLKPDGLLHLKTDSTLMYEFTLDTVKEMNHQVVYSSADIYHETNANPDVTELQTYYERRWLKEGRIIKYLQFKLNPNNR